MKKIVIALLSLMTVSAMATETAYVGIKLTGKTTAASTNYKIRITEDSLYANGYVDGEEAEILNFTPSNSNSVFLYALVGTHKCSSIYETTISNMPMGFQTNRVDDEYTLTFTTVAGRALKIYDKVLDSLFTIDANVPYEFEVNATNCPGFVLGQNKLIEDRFVIESILPEPTICHQYGNLIITGHKGAKVKVLDMEGEVAITEQTLATDNEVIDLSTLSSGRYQVEFNGKKFIIAVNP